MKELESQIVSSKNDLEEAYGLFQKLNYLKERQSQLEMEIKELEKNTTRQGKRWKTSLRIFLQKF